MVFTIFENEYRSIPKQRISFPFVGEGSESGSGSRSGSGSCCSLELSTKFMGHGGGRKYAFLENQLPEDQVPHHGKVNDVFNAMRYVLRALGRFPFNPYLPSGQSKYQRQGEIEERMAGINVDNRNYDKSFKGNNYSSSVKSLAWVYFGLTSLFLLILLFLSIGSFVGVFLSWCFLYIPPWTIEETDLFKFNLIPFVLVWSCLLSSSVGNVSFLLNRRNISKFLNYWNVAIDEMNLVVPDELKTFLHMSNLWFLIFAGVLVLSTNVLTINQARGGSTLMGVIALRILVPDIEKEYNSICRWFGMGIILYAMYASRALLFFFVFKCKLLRYCIKMWNSRLRAELEGCRRQSQGATLDEETNCKKLFCDHVILLKLVRLTDKVFAGILLSYFGSQILNMCFELYYVTMSNTSTTVFNKGGGDGLDTFIAILLLIQNIYVFLCVSLYAAYVAEEANKSIEIVKIHGISVNDSVSRRHLILSLQMSFQQRICLTGGHYFPVDKPFIVTVLSAVVTYFIIILQYGQQYSCEDDRFNMSGFGMQHVEIK